MADSPTNEFPQHGGQGKGPYGAGWPDNQLTTPNFRGRRLGEHNPDVYTTNYPDYATTATHVNPPSDPEAIGIKVHPFKLERYTKILTNEERYLGLGGDADPAKIKTLRVYYGELWSTVSVIKTKATLVADASLSPGASDPNVNVYGISSQLEIPGINRTVIPQFSDVGGGDDPNAIRREVHKFVEFSEKFDKAFGEAESDGGAYGIVILKFHVNVDESSDTPVGEITRAYIDLVPTTDDIGDEQGSIDQLIEELAEKEKDGNDGLRRENDNEGIYTVVIGESRDMELQEDDPDNLGQKRLVNEGKSPIDQQVYDNIYWAATIVTGSDSVNEPQTPPPPPPVTTTYITPSYPGPGVVAVEPPPRNIVVINGNKNVQGNE